MLDVSNTPVVDLSPIKNLPLQWLRCDFRPERDADIVRSIKSLVTVNDKRKTRGEILEGTRRQERPEMKPIMNRRVCLILLLGAGGCHQGQVVQSVSGLDGIASR